MRTLEVLREERTLLLISKERYSLQSFLEAIEDVWVFVESDLARLVDLGAAERERTGFEESREVAHKQCTHRKCREEAVDHEVVRRKHCESRNLPTRAPIQSVLRPEIGRAHV